MGPCVVLAKELVLWRYILVKIGRKPCRGPFLIFGDDFFENNTTYFDVEKKINVFFLGHNHLKFLAHEYNIKNRKMNVLKITLVESLNTIATDFEMVKEKRERRIAAWKKTFVLLLSILEKKCKWIQSVKWNQSVYE